MDLTNACLNKLKHSKWLNFLKPLAAAAQDQDLKSSMQDLIMFILKIDFPFRHKRCNSLFFNNWILTVGNTLRGWVNKTIFKWILRCVNLWLTSELRKKGQTKRKKLIDVWKGGQVTGYESICTSLLRIRGLVQKLNVQNQFVRQ